MARMKVSGWGETKSFEIGDHLAEIIGGEPHFVLQEKNDYLYCEVRDGADKVVASSTFPSKDFPFPSGLTAEQKPRFIFCWLFPSDGGWLQ